MLITIGAERVNVLRIPLIVCLFPGSLLFFGGDSRWWAETREESLFIVSLFPNSFMFFRVCQPRQIGVWVERLGTFIVSLFPGSLLFFWSYQLRVRGSMERGGEYVNFYVFSVVVCWSCFLM